MKQKIVIEITEDGDPIVDIVGATGSGCAKDAETWAKLSGGGAKVTRKPEFFQKNPKGEIRNTQTNR